MAARHVAEHGLSNVSTTATLDGRNTGLPAGRFDFATCNSTLRHMHEPLALLREMKRVLRPGGGLLIRDLERPATMDDAWEIVKRVAAGESMQPQQLFFDSLCAALTSAEVRRLIVQVDWGELEVTRSSDRHWSVSTLLGRS